METVVENGWNWVSEFPTDIQSRENWPKEATGVNLCLKEFVCVCVCVYFWADAGWLTLKCFALRMSLNVQQHTWEELQLIWARESV